MRARPSRLANVCTTVRQARKNPCRRLALLGKSETLSMSILGTGKTAFSLSSGLIMRPSFNLNTCNCIKLSGVSSFNLRHHAGVPPRSPYEFQVLSCHRSKSIKIYKCHVLLVASRLKISQVNEKMRSCSSWVLNGVLKNHVVEEKCSTTTQMFTNSQVLREGDHFSLIFLATDFLALMYAQSFLMASVRGIFFLSCDAFSESLLNDDIYSSSCF